MEELIKRLERVIATGASDKDGMHPISAEAVLEVVKQLSEHGTNLAEVSTDLISRQQAIDDIWTVSPLARLDRKWVDRWLRQLPSAQPEPPQVARDIARIVENEKDMRVIAQPEIIRCKDCKHYKYGICKKAGLCVNKSPNGFCDWGEREEEGET